MWRGLLDNNVYVRRMGNLDLLLLITVLASAVYLLWIKKRRKLPPGPWGLPIFGYYPFLRKNPVEKITELANKYGNVMGMYIGPRYVVVLSDWEAVKDGLGQNATSARPPSQFARVQYKFGFGGMNGPEWVEGRRLSSKVLKDGLQRNHWEDLIQKELSEVVEQIKRAGEKPIELVGFFRDSFSNNVVSLIFGGQLHIEKATKQMISKSVDFIMESFSSFSITNFSDALTMLLWKLGLEHLPPIAEETREFFKYVSDAVDSNKQNLNLERNDTFITRFQEEIENRKKIGETSMTDDNLKGSILTLMVGGSETTRTAIVWALIAMADQPEKQRKVHEELDRTVGKEASIRWSDRFQIPYTLAVLLEAMRWKTLIPVPGMRMVTEDTQIQGYYVPKGTFVLTNVWRIHNDPKYWKSPEEFMPERFLQEEGRKVNLAPDSFMAFSYGKRNCPGKLLALIDMLQYFGTLMQKFTVVPKEGGKAKYVPALGLSYQARNVELRFIPR